MSAANRTAAVISLFSLTRNCYCTGRGLLRTKNISSGCFDWVTGCFLCSLSPAQLRLLCVVRVGFRSCLLSRRQRYTVSLQYRAAASGGFIFIGANRTLLGLVEDGPSLLLLCFAPSSSVRVDLYRVANSSGFVFIGTHRVTVLGLFEVVPSFFSFAPPPPSSFVSVC